MVAAVSSTEESSSSDTEADPAPDSYAKNKRYAYSIAQCKYCVFMSACTHTPLNSPSKKTDPRHKEGLQHLITMAFQQVRNQVSSGIRFVVVF